MSTACLSVLGQPLGTTMTVIWELFSGVKGSGKERSNKGVRMC